eukprot:scaffold342046_cov45-Prasinocladus_malaysianus.AAC.1
MPDGGACCTRTRGIASVTRLLAYRRLSIRPPIPVDVPVPYEYSYEFRVFFPVPRCGNSYGNIVAVRWLAGCCWKLSPERGTGAPRWKLI